MVNRQNFITVESNLLHSIDVKYTIVRYLIRITVKF